MAQYEFKVLKDVPRHIGRGEGGGKLPSLYNILKQIDQKLSENGDRLDELEK